MPASTTDVTGGDWKRALRTAGQRGYTLVNRLALWFSLLMVAVVVSRLADTDWGNFRRQAGYHLFVVGWLLAVSYSLRSVGSREVLRFWLTGFFPVTLVAYVLTEFTEGRLDPGNLQTAGVVPVAEELVKILPLVLWTTLLRPKHRHGTLSDFLVLGFAIGAGFSFHEDALYTRVAASGFDDGLLGTLFPIFLSSGQYAITHAGWTALAGVGVGLISLHRHRPAALVAGLALIVVPIVDHAAVNWRGDGADRLMSFTRDGHMPAWLLLGVVIAVVVHDGAALRWASARDRLFPPPAFAGDVAVLQEGPLPDRIARLALRQQYRRRRNATFVDLFSVRSRGVSAGERTRVRRELEVARDRVGIAPSAEAPLRSVGAPRASGAGPDAATPPQQSPRRRGAVLVLLGAVGVAALALWWTNRSDDTPDDAFVLDDAPPFAPATDAPGPDLEPGDVVDPTFDPPANDASSPDEYYGPVIDEPLFLRWEQSLNSGLVVESTLAVDGDRELWVQAGFMQYQDSEISVGCVGYQTDDVMCFPADRVSTLAVNNWAGGYTTADVPGATTELRRIAGRDASCVSIEFDEQTSTLSCTDVETQVQLLLETSSVTIVGQRESSRFELVEWGTPTESDFEIPPEARAVTADS
ncbi:MAG: PrsW family glutamic-type intramembrane protease [Acidimicrobiales bacterium]